MKKYVPGCLGVTIGLLAALGIIFAILKPLGINNSFLFLVLLFGGPVGGLCLFEMYAPKDFQDHSSRHPWDNQ